MSEPGSLPGVDAEAIAPGDPGAGWPIRHVGVISPGEMGTALAIRLAELGLTVHCALDGRSDRTRGRAARAGLVDEGAVERLVDACDLVISVVSPARAPEVATIVAAAVRATRSPAARPLIFADLNAISPGTARREDELLRAAGAIFIDGGVIGPPPRGEKARPRLYLAGPQAGLLEQIRHPNLEIRVLSDRVGDASALKMCCGAMTKGVTALTTELLVAAHRLGVEEAALSELRGTRDDVVAWQLGGLAVMPPKAYRWVPEMQEIARTFAELGMPPGIFEGAADLFAMVAETPLAQEAPEEARASGRDGLEVIRSIAESG
jgi:3-hydroxyisobutyrate dehydrogenase-like beta-hydroxyacid dehydrogenase